MLKGSQLLRYEKHIDLINFGEERQYQLLNSRVAVIGAGGLGCPTALYLCASGLGNIKLIDNDTVSYTNLARQFLYNWGDVNKLKVDIAKEKLGELNPDCKIDAINQRLYEDNALTHLSDCDLIIDATDNFETRYLLNKCAIKLKKPLLSGSVVNFTGQVITFHPTDSDHNPCYNCLYPIQPGHHDVPACVDSGVLSPITGVIGSIMATEAIKYLLKIGNISFNEMIVYGALNNSFHKIKINKLDTCISCK